MSHSCKGCEKRYIGCHDHCESYQNFLKEKAVIAKNRQNFYLKRYPNSKKGVRYEI